MVSVNVIKMNGGPKNLGIKILILKWFAVSKINNDLLKYLLVFECEGGRDILSRVTF